MRKGIMWVGNIKVTREKGSENEGVYTRDRGSIKVGICEGKDII